MLKQLLSVLFILFVSVTCRPAFLPTSERASASGVCVDTKVQSIEFLSEFNIESGYIYKNTTVGGLSAITYDHTRNVYYLLSDDRTGEMQRFYTAKVNLTSYKVEIIDVTFLTRISGMPFANNDLDPEGIVYTDSDTIIISSERAPPLVLEFHLNGKLIRYFNVPDYYVSNADGTFGVRNNLGFEGLSLSPDGKILWAANEGALSQDGPKSSLTEKSPTRLMSFNMRTGNPVDEFIIYSDKIAKAPIPETEYADNGITEIISLTKKAPKKDLTFLSLERSFSLGATLPDRGYTVKLYEITTKRAKNVRNMDTIPKGLGEAKAVKKTLLADMGKDFGIILDNLEGLQMMKTGCGEAILIVMSDDNFSAFGPQSSQFVFLKVKGDL